MNSSPLPLDPPADPLLAERDRLGSLQQLRLSGASMRDMHADLGRQLAEPIRRAFRTRLQRTDRNELVRRIELLRRGASGVWSRPRSEVATRWQQAAFEYADCLAAWSQAAELSDAATAELGTSLTINGEPVSGQEWAIWMQDDNAGCQTGLTRLADHSVLFWHTEEDTVGLFDRPRLAVFSLPEGEWFAFLYPYLLPGPAFGWSHVPGGGGFHALDSLHIQPVAAGLPTAVAAWVMWRLATASAIEVVRGLGPFVDAAAVHWISFRTGSPADSLCQAEIIEFGGTECSSRTLGARPGDWEFQVNVIHDRQESLARLEAVDDDERPLYDARLRRAESLLCGRTEPLSPRETLAALASRDGGDYANANVDVKAHVVGVARPGRLSLHIGSGPALPGDIYRPQFEVS